MAPWMKRSVTIFALVIVACSGGRRRMLVEPTSPGMISGTLLFDGSPLPGATVSVIGDKVNRITVSDGNGRFRVIGLRPGTYTVRSELDGLGTVEQRVVLTAERGVDLLTVMRSASVAETITVVGEAPGVTSTYTYAAASVAPPPPPKPQSPRPQYAAIEEHGFIETATQRVTTFAIDVDHASYANVRRLLTSGLVPPPDAVRVEEMINYFPYDYPQPTGDVPFSISSEVAGCPWSAAHRLVRIGLQGANLDQWKMAPNNLVFLLDVSGSMSPPSRLPLIQAAFHLLVDQLRAEDRVAIVVYAGAAGLVLPSTSGADKSTILAAIDRLQAGGSTAGGEGIELAYKIAKENLIESGNNRVILATDGDFNVGPYGLEELEKLIESKRRSDVFLSVIGVGDDNYQDAAMELLADKGNGNFAYLDSMKEAEKVFKRELTGTLVTIAKDVKIQIDFDPSLVASYRQIGYENRAMENKDFDDDTKDGGELGAGHSVTALFEIVPTGAAGGTIASIKLRYKRPKGNDSRLIESAVVDEGRSAYEASADFQFAAAVAEFGMLLRNSPHKGSASWEDVGHLARIAAGPDLDGLREELIRIAESGKAIMGNRVAAR